MKKMTSLLALLLVLALLCCGCAPKTPEAVVDRMNAALLKTPCSRMETTAAFDMSMDMGMLGAMDMQMEMAMDMTVCQEPVGMYMQMDLDMSVAGESMSTTAESYLVMEGEELMNYTCAEGQWIKTAATEDFASMTESMTAVDLTGAVLAIDDTVTEWNGQKVICLTMQVTGESVEGVLGDMMQGNEAMASLGEIDWSALQCDGVIYVDAKTYLPLAEEMTVTGMDAAMSSAFEDMGVTVEISNFEVSVIFTSFEVQPPIELPAAAADAVDMGDLSAAA